jgi:hypothetical protein
MDASLPSSPAGSNTVKSLEPSLPSVAGVKRPAPSLLPAFEPLSSSPGLPRPAKRQAFSSAYSKYPTPVPTSSTGILSSSPPRLGPSRPTVQRMISSVTERAPLSSVPSVELNENGEPVLMGRSSNSSHYQLSANRLISRVHVKARYVTADSLLEANKVEIVCNGWNGLKLHCQGRTWDLGKGDTFTSETEGAEIMIDVQDARVLVQWPRKDKDRTRNLSDSEWDESPRPARGNRSELHGSPLKRSARIESPVSPTPASFSASQRLQDLMPDANDQDESVQIYEDADEPELPKLTEAEFGETFMTEVTNSFSSDLSDPLSDAENDPDEENDPIVHSFGPFGANLTGRLASITASSPPKRPRAARAPALSPIPSGISTAPLQPSHPNSLQGSPKMSTSPASPVIPASVDKETVTNHVINQLAFSRLSSNPLTGILNNLPAEERKDLTKDGLRSIIEAVPCVGIIPRQGKDAAGKPLESEYYYIPEHDTDEHRRLAVTESLRKPSLRNCRKQHKVGSSLNSMIAEFKKLTRVNSNTTGNVLVLHDRDSVSTVLLVFLYV